jgi:hypothetical protein
MSPKMPRKTPQMARFNDALRQVMTITKPELTALLKDPEAVESVAQKRGRRPKTKTLGRASSLKD